MKPVVDAPRPRARGPHARHRRARIVAETWSGRAGPAARPRRSSTARWPCTRFGGRGVRADARAFARVRAASPDAVQPGLPPRHRQRAAVDACAVEAGPVHSALLRARRRPAPCHAFERRLLQRPAVGEAQTPRLRPPAVDRVEVGGGLLGRLSAGEEEDARIAAGTVAAQHRAASAARPPTPPAGALAGDDHARLEQHVFGARPRAGPAPGRPRAAPPP